MYVHQRSSLQGRPMSHIRCLTRTLQATHPWDKLQGGGFQAHLAPGRRRQADWECRAGMEREMGAIICPVSLSPSRGYKCYPPAPSGLPFLQSHAVFLSLHKFSASSHKKCNEQSGWRRLAMEQAASHTSPESSSGHGPAQRKPGPEGPLLRVCMGRRDMGIFPHLARHC